MGKVKYGLKNIHYALWDSTGEAYETPVACPGAKTLSVEYDGETSNFYADDGVYFTSVTSSSITGTLEIADTEDQMLIDLLGYFKQDKALFEDMDATGKEFALLFEVDGDPLKRRCCYYSCKLSRPSSEYATREETVEPNTDSYNFSATGKSFEIDGETRSISKVTVPSDDTTNYSGFFDAVLLPKEQSEAA